MCLMSMNKISNIGNPNFQQKALVTDKKEKDLQPPKFYAGKAIGSAVGAGSGALGGWYVGSVLKENAENIKTFVNAMFKTLGGMDSQFADIVKFYEENTPLADKFIKNTSRAFLVVGTATVALLGLSIGAIVDGVRKKFASKTVEVAQDSDLNLLKDKAEKDIVNVEVK